MSIDTIEETFAALTEGLSSGLACEVHEGVHNAGWFLESKCPSCAAESTSAVCDSQYYQLLADKNKRVMGCRVCGNLFKPFEIFQTTRKVG